ncbi:MAG: B12-binding domain-containing radical SAM protein [Deltaproteobacteria bacterium]|nr:B12-binding domain-containing radical SAM protein [Deltaproteobacteria bacterium]
MHYEGTIIRPPSEALSILLQVTLGCSHNKCTFCGTYKDKHFTIKDDQTIMADIRFASKYMSNQHRLFLMDGDGLIIPQRKLVWILKMIKEHLPWVRRVGAYANAKSVKMKSDEDLVELKEKGLGILYLGVESGDNETLRRVCKGSTAENLIKQGQRIKAAGIKLSVTVLLGIAGRANSLKHARATGRLLSAMDPNYIGALTVMILPNTPLDDDYRAGRFELPDTRELLVELREMFKHTHLSGGLFMANHASNYLPIKARLPKDREKTLALIDAALRGEIDLKPEWMRGL